jgi:hypothetical protein
MHAAGDGGTGLGSSQQVVGRRKNVIKLLCAVGYLYHRVALDLLSEVFHQLLYYD